MNDYFIFGTLNQVCINEKCDSMYGWYGFNAQITWKIIYFGWFLISLGPLESKKRPHILSKQHINDYLLWDTTLNRVCSNDKFASMHGWYGFNAQIMWKICNFLVIFDDFWDLWSPDRTPDPTPDALWMIILSLGHSIMCVPMRNLIQCMGDMALMPKICEK